MVFLLCECVCAFSSSSIVWTPCCKTDSERADRRCEFGYDPEDARICRRTSHSACIEIAFAFVVLVPLAVNSMTKTKIDVKEQKEKLLDFPMPRFFAYEAKEIIFLPWACTSYHAVSSATGGARKGDRDTRWWRRVDSCSEGHLESE